MKINTIRDLARELGLSHTTVSDALRNNPRVCARTRERVQGAAKEYGYHYNALAGSVMSEIRRSNVCSFQGTLAVVDMEAPGRRDHGANNYHNQILASATETAGKHGFRINHFVLGETKITIPRLQSILDSRGIQGLLVLPSWGTPSLKELDWTRLTGIYTDYLIQDPPIHSVCPDHFRSMTIALQKLFDLGYRRPGLALIESHDRRLHFRWEAAFSAFSNSKTGDRATKPLVTADLTKNTFLDWFVKEAPDVVLCHGRKILSWMLEEGYRVPETHGYCCLNLSTAEFNGAGLDLLPRLAGQRGAEALIAQLHRNEFGIPEVPSIVTYPAVWRDGPTVREQKFRTERSPESFPVGSSINPEVMV